MQEVNKSETFKQGWVCKPRTNDQLHNSSEQKGCDIFVDNLFEEAQKLGAICTPETEVKSQADTTIRLWKNGFTVNDGELRTYSDVANQRFLDSVKKGELPLEFQKVFDKEEVAVKVDDKKNEVYTLRKPLFHPFSGQGYRLGSATPRIISKVKRNVDEMEKRRPTVVLNNLEPVTSIQIWLADGTRIVQKFNISHRISHIRDFIMDFQGPQGRCPFTLTTSLPFWELLDESLTLEEANLKNAVIVQRLKKDTDPFRSLS
ncbi:UBX domain-containing protein 2A [Tiliqua scincoides]|uniref:UBX domain-containing protein 2A n=1 Tax=Tiliqua scincoides TaxID=71010 RepID=UPI00346290A8